MTVGRLTLTQALNDIASATYGMSATAAANLIANAVAAVGSSPFSLQGSYDASGNSPDLEAPAAGVVLSGYTYKVSVAGDFFTEPVDPGDTLVALVDDPSALSDWLVLQSNLDYDASGNLTVPGTATVGGAIKSTTGLVESENAAGHAYSDIDGAASSSSALRLLSAGSGRWFLERLATSHDFQFRNAAGTSVLKLAQSDGAATFASDVTVGGDASIANGALTVNRDGGSGSIYFVSGTGWDAGLRLMTGTTGTGGHRWIVGKDGSSESGSNAGADLWFKRYSDAGSPLGTALSITRATGAATFENNVTVGGDVELGSGGPTITTTVGSPEGVVTANSGSINIQTDITYGSIRVKADDGDATGWSYVPVSDGTDALNRIYYGKSAGLVGGSTSFTFDGSTFTTPNVKLGSSGPTITTGTAVPSASEPQGSKYIRTTSLGDHEYVSLGGGSWIPTGASDTGVRDLSGETLSNGWTVNGSFFSVQRSGNTVSISAFFDGSAASAAAIFILPSGFRPAFTAQGEARFTTAASTGRFMNIDTGGVIQILNYGAGVHYVSATFTTTDAWPTSLPGA